MKEEMDQSIKSYQIYKIPAATSNSRDLDLEENLNESFAVDPGILLQKNLRVDGCFSPPI